MRGLTGRCGGVPPKAAGRPALVGLGVLLLATAGCGPSLRALRAEGAASRAEVGGLRAFRQEERACGPAALATLLEWAGSPASPEELAPLVYLPGRSGTLSLDLAREARARGLLAYRIPPRVSALLREVSAGHPVLVLENRGLSFAPVWHYSVLAGYDLDEATVTLYAGAARAETAPFGAFRRGWVRAGSFGLLALGPGDLPAAADPRGICAALADLEEAGKSAAAASGYRALLERWPDEWRGAFGLGNALHALGDDEGAEAAYRRANAAGPERPEPLNNLAMLALGRGERARALGLAEEAVAKATALGLETGPFEETREEVRGR